MRYVAITGYAHQYRISEAGCVEKYNVKQDVWTPVPVKRKTRAEVNLIRNTRTGDRHTVAVTTLMANAFMGGRSAHPGLVISHKNGMVTDCALENLYWTTREALGKVCGCLSRKPVVKLDGDGNVVHTYSSIQECCEAEFIHRSTLHRMMKKRTPASRSSTGYTYEFES